MGIRTRICFTTKLIIHVLFIIAALVFEVQIQFGFIGERIQMGRDILQLCRLFIYDNVFG